MINIDLRGLTPAPVTPFTRDGRVDYDAIQRLGNWLGSIDGVKGLVVRGIRRFDLSFSRLAAFWLSGWRPPGSLPRGV